VPKLIIISKLFEPNYCSLCVWNSKLC